MGSHWIFRPRDVLDANSPSRLDGVSAEREEAKRLAYTGLLRDCGEAMKMCALRSYMRCSATQVGLAALPPQRPLLCHLATEQHHKPLLGFTQPAWRNAC